MWDVCKRGKKGASRILLKRTLALLSFLEKLEGMRGARMVLLRES